MPEDQPLDRMLATLAPEPQGEYVFALVDEVPSGVNPFAIIRDDDKYTVVLKKEEAESVGLPFDKTYAHLSLGLDADLDSIGVTSTISQVLSARSIVANAIACARHDHFFVQADRADEAAQILADLGKNARGWLPQL